jgi:hypothetical protein
VGEWVQFFTPKYLYDIKDTTINLELHTMISLDSIITINRLESREDNIFS